MTHRIPKHTTTQNNDRDGAASTRWVSRLGRGTSSFWGDFSWANQRMSEMRADLHRDNAF